MRKKTFMIFLCTNLNLIFGWVNIWGMYMYAVSKARSCHHHLYVLRPLCYIKSVHEYLKKIYFFILTTYYNSVFYELKKISFIIFKF